MAPSDRYAQSNLSLYAVLAFVVLDTDGNRVLAKYYKPKHAPTQFTDYKALTTLKDQRAFEKGLWDKTKKPGGASKLVNCACASSPTGDIIIFEGLLAVYKHSLDLIIYVVAPQQENELMLNAALTAYCDALSLLLRGQIEKRAVTDSLDLALLCLDETIDDGFVRTRLLRPLHN